MRGLLTTAFVGVAALCLAAGTALAGDVTAATCNGPGAASVVNVTFALTNDADSGFGGNAWASDTIHRSLRIWGFSMVAIAPLVTWLLLVVLGNQAFDLPVLQ